MLLIFDKSRIKCYQKINQPMIFLSNSKKSHQLALLLESNDETPVLGINSNLIHPFNFFRVEILSFSTGSIRWVDFFLGTGLGGCNQTVVHEQTEGYII